MLCLSGFELYSRWVPLMGSDAIFREKISPALEPFQNKDSSLVLLLV